MLRKLISALLTVAIIVTVGATSVFAQDNVIPTDNNKSFEQKIKDGEVKVTTKFTLDEQKSGIQPYYWPGSGSIPSLSSITKHRQEWISNTNYGVTLRVMGYGTNLSTYKGQRINPYASFGVVLSGTIADGFDDYFDLGPITGPGTITLNIRYRCSNDILSEISGRWDITFSLA